MDSHEDWMWNRALFIAYYYFRLCKCSHKLELGAMDWDTKGWQPRPIVTSGLGFLNLSSEPFSLSPERVWRTLQDSVQQGLRWSAGPQITNAFETWKSLECIHSCVGINFVSFTAQVCIHSWSLEGGHCMDKAQHYAKGDLASWRTWLPYSVWIARGGGLVGGVKPPNCFLNELWLFRPFAVLPSGFFTPWLVRQIITNFVLLVCLYFEKLSILVGDNGIM